MVQQADRVFVVHGRDLGARNALFDFLTSIGLHPIEWTQALAMTGVASPHISSTLEAAFSKAQAIIVLLTPDDEARLKQRFALGPKDPELALQGQARPNVLFEAGMAFGLQPERTILAALGELRDFSDVAGRLVLNLSNDAEVRNEFASRLRVAGCVVDTSGSRWLQAGDFDGAREKSQGDPEGEILHSGTTGTQWVTYGQIRLRLNDVREMQLGSTRVLGEAINEGQFAQLVSISATFADKAGATIGIANGSVAQIGKGERKAFTLMSSDDLSTFATMTGQVDFVL